MRAALEETAAVEVVDADDVAQTPLEGEAVIPAEAADVGVDDVMGAKVDDELDVDADVEEELAVEDDAVVEAVDAAGVTPVAAVVDPDEIEDAGVVAVVAVDEDEMAEDVAACPAAVDAAADAGEHTVVVVPPAPGAPETVPALALLVWVPVAGPPEVLI